MGGYGRTDNKSYTASTITRFRGRVRKSITEYKGAELGLEG